MKSTLALLGTLVLAASAAVAGPVLTITPGNAISGPPGSTIGWGYELFNDSTNFWYLPSSVSTPSFVDGVPTVLFDYPSIAPLSAASQVYTGTLGLLQLALFPGATVGDIDQGNVIMSGDYWTGDPFTDPNATIAATAPDAIAPITATVTPNNQVPEPSFKWLLTAGLVLILLGRLRPNSQGIYRAGR